jgi:hypothetical protein
MNGLVETVRMTTGTLLRGGRCDRTQYKFAGNTALMKPYSSFQDRVSQFDVRVIKNLRFSGGRVQLQLDAYNLFNSATILTQRAAYGSAWLQPQTIMSGRVIKFGIQSDS